jgi:hypothetical protein
MRVRLVEMPGVHPHWRIEIRRWFQWWHDAGFQDYDELKDAQDKYMIVVANRGPKIVVAQTP